MVPRIRETEAAEARAIVRAVRALQANPELLDEARRDLPATLDRVGLSGTARHALAATLTLSAGGVVLPQATAGFWA
jgi:hypothetical protein